MKGQTVRVKKVGKWNPQDGGKKGENKTRKRPGTKLELYYSVGQQGKRLRNQKNPSQRERSKKKTGGQKTKEHSPGGQKTERGEKKGRGARKVYRTSQENDEVNQT